MQIKFLGTSHGVPEAHKKCASTLVKVGEYYYFIDAGCDIAAELACLRIPFEKVKAIFITHTHTDHTNGLIPFLTITHWYYTASDFTVFLPSEKLAKSYKEVIFPVVEGELRDTQRIEAYSEGAIYDDENLQVFAYPTQHCSDSHAFLLQAEGKRVLFTGDLKKPTVDFPSVTDLDIVVGEGAHFDITEYESVLADKNVGALYINHYGNYIGRDNRKNQKLLEQALGIPVILTSDGQSIDI